MHLDLLRTGDNAEKVLDRACHSGKRMRFQLADVEYNIRIGYRINDIEIFARSALRRRESAKAHIIVKLAPLFSAAVSIPFIR